MKSSVKDIMWDVRTKRRVNKPGSRRQDFIDQSCPKYALPACPAHKVGKMENGKSTYKDTLILWNQTFAVYTLSFRRRKGWRRAIAKCGNRKAKVRIYQPTRIARIDTSYIKAFYY